MNKREKIKAWLIQFEKEEWEDSLAKETHFVNMIYKDLFGGKK